ncbi:MAG: glycosyltransferase family 4 protein [Candidatus Pacebacteria bacterium]|nr:glycosyltransferase family 4 protein [Candidatus Paceibacterota bacterium]
MNSEQNENQSTTNHAPRRLLICTQSVDRDDPIAGFFYSWVCEFSKYCEKVTVIALSGTGVEHLPINVQVVSLEKELQASKFRQLHLFYKAIIKHRHEYDTVFIHNVGPKFVLLGALFWKLWRKRIALWYVHGSVHWKLRVAEKLVDQAFSSAPETFRVPSKKVTFLGHGINVEKLGSLPLHLDLHCFTILQVSRISPRKHCDVLIEALSIFAAQYAKPFRVLFVGATTSAGDEEYLLKLHERVNELGLSEQVSFVGGVSPQKLPEYYTRADVTVNVTTTGGVDKTALESLAVGVPVLTTFGAFKKILGEESYQCVLSELNEGTSVELADALLRVAQYGTSQERRKVLKNKVTEYASLSRLIQRIITILYTEQKR